MSDPGLPRHTIGDTFLGGPDRVAGTLRAQLLQRVRETPAGGAIDWATCYFLDTELAQALIDASGRGVDVTLVVEGDPGAAHANDPVLALLRADGLRDGLTIRPRAPRPVRALAGRLHLKIYAFSHPSPVALVGSFDPAGGPDVDPAVLKAIGDRDRAHNLLVAIEGTRLVERLVRHVRLLGRRRGAIGRLSIENNRVVRERETALYFYPRLRTRIVEPVVARLGQGDRLWATVSHIGRAAADVLVAAGRRGVRLELVVDDSRRRVPAKAIVRMRRAGVGIRRLRLADELPMQARFVVTDRAGVRTAWFGSHDFTRRARLLNDELLVETHDPALIATLIARFADLARAADRPPPGGR
ncbi:phospholipase D-like domain-containing protein [Sphingomonas solaris]|uniref:Phospholipase D-like domain-containing protein n=1 Tax=Alterirhizorhabdus solaris TaxID=2529389 RepID=A0A558QWQ6_9SPHN|nr:phospholipase D-like domain-containing protein [Sphingomonas solaris]TVV71529.1 hypothetical protein FOY91_16630 [Sphingomonas solaris]